MSSDSTSALPIAPPVLSLHERRVLGVLVEKQKTTPDVYPLSPNALLTACNQKSNRDPLLNLTDLDVEEALVSCQKKGLVMKITGGRVERWRHTLYDTWRVSKIEMAVLAELLLRGPQTEGELRGRVSRMEPIEDLDKLRAVCQPLAERKFVVYLTPEGRRGTMLTHGFQEAKDVERLKTMHFASADSAEQELSARATRPTAERPPPPDDRRDESLGQIAALQAALAELQGQVEELSTRLRQLEAKNSVQ